MIRNEHRDYLQVLECLCRLLDRLEERGGEKRRLLFLILDSVEAFPATFHHPKEEDYLFAALGRRRHLGRENRLVLPLARKRLTGSDLESLGRAMATRRGVPYPG